MPTANAPKIVKITIFSNRVNILPPLAYKKSYRKRNKNIFEKFGSLALCEY